MLVDYKVSRLYDEAMEQVVSNAEAWKSICRLTGRLYRYEFDNILLIYVQRPGATLVADYDTWKDPRVGRYVKRGSKGIAIFPSRALKPYMRYVFDIKDTEGRKNKLTWELNKENVEAYAADLGWHKEQEKESAEHYVKCFTEKRIGVIMDSEFGERITELTHLAGSKRYLVDDKTQEITAEEVLKRSIEYAVFTRCGFDISPEKQDFSFITAFQGEEEIYRLGSLVSDISCEVLRSIGKELTQTERSIAYGREDHVLRSGGRDALSQPDLRAGEGRDDESGQVRSPGDGIPEREPQGEVQDSSEVREAGGKDAGSGGRSQRYDGSFGEQLSETESTEKSAVNNGNVETQGAGKDAGRGNRHEGSRTEVPLEEPERLEQLNKEVSREIEEMESLGSEEKGSYEQASFSFAPNGDIELPGKYTYLSPKKEPVIPHEYVREALLRGSGFVGGKARICEIFNTVSDAGERVKRIRKEYGQGGAGWPIEGYGLHGYDTFHGKGIRFQWRDAEGEKEGYLNWNAVERELSVLILSGEYYQPPKEPDSKQEEKIWLDSLKKYFHEEIQFISVKALIYDIFTTNLTLESKAAFLQSIYGKEREAFSMSEKLEGLYGESCITRGEDGITVSYVKPDGTRGEHKEDYLYCASLLLHMIEENDYLSEEVFEQFRLSPQSFQASPAFMEIYHEYKNRMEMEPNFEALELEEDKISESGAIQAKKDENIEKVEGEILDQSGTVIKHASAAAFPAALEHVETMEEDLRDAIEIYLLGCSSIRPFQPFLQMVHQSGLAKTDKLYFLNRIVNYYADEKDTRSAYHNNAYGLIEYISNPNSFTIDYKNRQGERNKASITYDEIYSVMEYLVRSGQFTDKARMENYENEFAEKPYKKLGSLEKQFADKLHILKARQQNENFHFEVSKLPKGGPKTRYHWNVEAIRLMKQIEHENRPATPEEKKILARYVGWGGIPQVFDEKNEDWKKEYEELKGLLTEQEYLAARESVTTAFYTSPEIIEAIYQGLEQFGFHGGSILEPSMGIGHFFGAMPENMRGSKLYGVEKDDVSGRIAKLLYPKAKVSISGFEKTQFPDNFFDVAVGNIPFGDFKLYDPKYAKHNFRIHDYFLAKALDKVRPGGIVAFVTSKGTMDKANPAVRKYLAERAELIGAVRLPNTAFKESAGTDVTSDIIFLQKWENKIVAEPDWVHLGQTQDGIAVNSYFVEHPEMMLGKMEYDTRMFGNESKYTSCINRDENFELKPALSKAVTNLTGKITDVMEIANDAEATIDVIDADPDVKNYTYTFIDGKLYYRENSKMYRKELPKATEERIRLLDKIRRTARQLIFIQSEGCVSEELKFQQKLLNDQYDAYVKKYGPITGKGSRQAFQDDGDYPLLCSLEVVDEDGNVKKADMFYKQTIRPKTQVEDVETATEALNVSVSELGAVNIPYMMSIYEPDISEAIRALPENSTLSVRAEADLKRAFLIKELTGLIFLDPMEYNENNLNAGWKTADEYLSGNVREKLRVAKAYAEENGELFTANVQALMQVQPKDLDASEIDVRIGTTWIELEDYEGFLYELLGTPYRARANRSGYRSSGIQVKYNPYGQNWHIENKVLDNRSIAATKTYGTGRIDAYSIMEETLNLRTVTVRDAIEEPNGNTHYEVNKKETMLAREKQNQMKEAFKEWLFKDQQRRQKYVEYYNNTFNCIRLRSYDGSFLNFTGMNPEIKLRDHQKNAVARILFGGNTLLAHVVGAGKTFTMMAACMEQKRLGLANKNVIVVPKPLIGQTAGEFMRLYPSANILVATERDFEKSRRKQFVSRIATGDYDCIIMSHSQFEKIPISKERKERVLNDQIQELSLAIEKVKQEKGEQWTIKQIERQKKKLEEQLYELADESRKDDLICFEDLGIDSIMVDEAHHYKNLAIFSKMNNVSGISSSGSKKAMDMQLKCQYLTEMNGGRGIVFATGTPVSNTMCVRP